LINQGGSFFLIRSVDSCDLQIGIAMKKWIVLGLELGGIISMFLMLYFLTLTIVI
tara:strand:- start:887 stop:1051 length:165 start_codon:yes stop_codon:yes gene_type:complete